MDTGRAMQLSLPRRDRKAAKASKADALRVLSGYVLLMSITSLGDADIEPLYEECMSDSRLGTSEREELKNAFRMLRGRLVSET